MNIENSTSEELVIKLKKNQLLFKEGSPGRDMFLVHEGELKVFVRNRSQISLLGIITKGEYIGELTFFDGRARSANVLATQETTLIRLPFDEIKNKIPSWLEALAKFMTMKIRLYDLIIQDRGIKRKNVQHISPLSIEEQRKYFRLIEDQAGVDS